MSNEKKGFTDLSLKHLINKIKSTFVDKTDVVSTSTIDVDTTPTEDSDNLVTSGGVYDALKTKLEQPSSGLSVDKILAIASIDSQGNVTLKAVDMSSGVDFLEVVDGEVCIKYEDGEQ